MSSAEIRAKIEVHAGEAQRLLRSHPLVAEFHHHICRVNELQPELQRLIEHEAAATQAEIAVPEVADRSENQE
ncbi:hypothetical protein [Planctomicrobium sp. SH527]|uniref:hypothetical protein n=1 Tax=Planctomicrobium sp. SH527 TaxID=3448123 RepID=UPI003F5C6FFD